MSVRGTLERTSLLDVQLQVGRELPEAASGVTDDIRVTTEGTDPIAHAAAATVHQVQGCRGQVASHSAAAYEPTFFVGEVHDLKCMAQSDVPIA